MRLGEGRLLKEVMREALKLGSRVKWVKELRMGLDAFGWQGLDVQALSGLTMNEVKHILKCMAWRKVREWWKEETRGRPKLEVMGGLMDCECKTRCVEIDCKRQRRMLMKLRGGTAELRVETGRWCGLRRDERVCKMCDRGEVEDVEHFFATLYRLGGGESGDGEVHERDCRGVARDGGQGEGGMGGRSGMCESKDTKGSGEAV